MYAQWRSLALDTSIMYWCLHRSKHCREETLSSSRPSRREQSQRKKSVDGLLVSMLLVLDRHNFHQRQRKCRIISVASNSMSPHQIFFISLSKTHIPQQYTHTHTYTYAHTHTITKARRTCIRCMLILTHFFPQFLAHSHSHTNMRALYFFSFSCTQL